MERTSRIYQHKKSREYLRLIKIRKSGVNTFLQVNKTNIPIIKKRVWSVKPAEQKRVIYGFDTLHTL